MRSLILIFFVLIVIFSSCQNKAGEEALVSSSPALEADSALIVSAHPLASMVGIDILKRGGNAVDAAIAVQFALAVVYPAAGNIGGGGFLVYRDKDGNAYTLDFREKAPLASTKTMFQDSIGNVIDKLSLRGHLAAGVPGSVDGMVKAHERFGTMSWEDLLQPSIDLALNGFVLTEKEARRLNQNRDDLEEYNSVLPEFLFNDDRWKEGDTIYYEDLGHTLERIRDEGREGFYSGKTADDIVAEMNRGNGIITHEDLQTYTSTWREPLKGKYKNYDIISMPPPSSGGVALLQLLKMVEPYKLEETNFHAPEAVHIIVEAERRVYADRARHLGDPDFYDVPVQYLTQEDYLQSRMNDFDPEKATPSSQISAGEPIAEHEQTTHFSIIDKYGNAASVTTTLNGSFGSKVVVDGSGFFLNNEMDDFSVKPGFPNMYGLLGGQANAIEPGKRMLSSMTPTIIEKDGKIFMVVGTPGGSTIITSVFQSILNVIDYEMDMQQAVNAKRFHHQWLPDKISYEDGAFTNRVRSELLELGHTLETRSAIGRVDAILVLENGKLQGGADPRGDDTAMGF